MNEIMEKLIQWCADNNYGVDISIHGSMGGLWLTLTLSHSRYNKQKRKYENLHLQHAFYIPNGVLCVENWQRGRCDLDLENFLEEAKEQFYGEG